MGTGFSIVHPAQSPPFERAGGPGLNLFVVFTTLAETQAALGSAVQLAAELDARVTVIAAQVVPYPLPLDRPPASCAAANLAAPGCELTVQVHLCRDEQQAIRSALPPGSLVLIGGRKSTLARALAKDGHRVIQPDRHRTPAPVAAAILWLLKTISR